MCPIRIVLLHQRDALVAQMAHIAFLSHLLATLAKKLETFGAQDPILRFTNLNTVAAVGTECLHLAKSYIREERPYTSI
jgi:hypothetical protein